MTDENEHNSGPRNEKKKNADLQIFPMLKEH